MAESTRDFEELLGCLTRHGVRFVIVGAHALAHHAKPRYTKDLDVFVDADPANARRIVAALEEFGFGGLGISPDDFSESGKIVQLGSPPTRIDLMTSIDGVTFEDAWQSRVEGAYGTASVPYIGYEALIRNKTASARAQDLADLEVLRRAKK
ncbi:MAG TPA: nucleotidyltransferase [Thermoanaerobaculia bacterium]|nr:nucleotidyltransferase [Thermoanaerobaculia bacterium]